MTQSSEGLRPAEIAWLAGLWIMGLLLMAPGLAAQDTIRINQRQDLRRQLNGTFDALYFSYGQAVWNLGVPQADGSRPVRAWTWTSPEAKTDLSHDAKPIAAEYRAAFVLGPDFSIRDATIGPAPFIRNFPAPPPRGSGPGATWEAPAVLMADPDHSGIWTRLNLMVQYSWVGKNTWRGQPVVEIKAKYAIRYKAQSDPAGNPNLRQAEGTRDATIYLDTGSLFPVFIREQLGHETWWFNNGPTIRNDGFILTFFEGTSPLEGQSGPLIVQSSPQPTARASPSPSPSAPAASDLGSTSRSGSADDKILARVDPEMERIKAAISTQGDKDLSLKTEDRGIKLTLENLQFAADSARLLPGEDLRLDRIAALLSTVPVGRNFLVIGHTALAGSQGGQKALSLERAKGIVEGLKKRGIDGGRFMYDGRGAAQPIADNNTEAGRAKNRRVEIIILD